MGTGNYTVHYRGENGAIVVDQRPNILTILIRDGLVILGGVDGSQYIYPIHNLVKMIFDADTE